MPKTRKGKHRKDTLQKRRERVHMREEPEDKKFWCRDCNVSFLSKHTDRHLRSRKHRRKMEEIRKRKGLK